MYLITKCVKANSWSEETPPPRVTYIEAHNPRLHKLAPKLHVHI